MKYVLTIRVDGRNFETKPFEASCEQEAISYYEKKSKLDFPRAEDVDIVNIEEVEQ